jgi:hypothetical protein
MDPLTQLDLDFLGRAAVNHLTHSDEEHQTRMRDIPVKSLKLLERVQLRFLRSMLGIGSRSLRAVLFSETGIWPIKYRRVYLALKNLCYLLELDHKRPAWNALQQSLSLARASKISWINDLRIVLSRLYIPVDLDISPDINGAMVELAMKTVKKSMEAWIDNEIESSSRRRDLLVAQLEKDKETGKLVIGFHGNLNTSNPAPPYAVSDDLIYCGPSSEVEHSNLAGCGPSSEAEHVDLWFVHAFCNGKTYDSLLCTGGHWGFFAWEE